MAGKMIVAGIVMAVCALIGWAVCVMGGREDDRAEHTFRPDWEAYYTGDPEHDQQVDAARWE